MGRPSSARSGCRTVEMTVLLTRREIDACKSIFLG
jgi:hypothetical protein